MPDKLPKTLQLSAHLDLVASDGAKQQKFKLVANTGTPFKQSHLKYPVIVDLNGARFAKNRTPVIADHDTKARIGHTTKQLIDQSGIYADGLVSSKSAAADGFVSDAKQGFPFEVSIGADMPVAELIEAGESVTVNGESYQGPLIVARETIIRELSILALGADNGTSAALAARRTSSLHKNLSVPKELEADELDIEAEATVETPKPTRRRLTKEDRRIDAIRAVAQVYEPTLRDPEIEIRADGHKYSFEQIQATAITEGWQPNELELHLLRAKRAAETAFPPYSGQRLSIDPGKVMEAKLAIQCGLRKPEAFYDEMTLNATDVIKRTHLMDVAEFSLAKDGKDYAYRNHDDTIRAAFATTQFSAITSNVAGKILLEQYNTFKSVARIVARKLSASDFKTKTGLRLTGTKVMEEVGADGEVKQGTVADSSFTFDVKTFAKGRGITRTDMINDDKSALADLPRIAAREAALTLETKFWTLVIANTGNFFHANNGNYIEGAGSALGDAGLALARQTFAELKDSDGNPITGSLTALVVPPALWDLGDKLYTSRTLGIVVSPDAGASADKIHREPQANNHFNRYPPYECPFIGTKGLSGGSDTAYYLFGNPADVAAFGIAYLNDVEVPTITYKEQPAGKLGIYLECVFDANVCQIDPKGAVKSKGTA